MEVMFESVLHKLISPKSDLPELTKRLSRSSLQSSSSDLYNDEKRFLKVFKNDKLSCRLFEAEKDTYDIINKIDRLEPYVPKLLGFSDTKKSKYLLMENKGVDGINVVNHETHKFSYDVWKRYLMDISTALKIMHEHELYHGDVKPENCTYDFNTKRWSLIDFGFTQRCRYGLCGFIGTIPYCSPHNILDYISIRTRFASPGIHEDLIGDLYSFAISALTLVGFYFSIENKPNVTLDIRNIVKLYNGDMSGLANYLIPENTIFDPWTLEIIHLLAGMALTQLDTCFRYLVWTTGKCLCYPIGHNDLPCQLESNDIMYYWNKFFVLVNLL